MTKRYPLGSALGSGDSGNSCDFEGAPLRVLEAAYGSDNLGRHGDEGLGNGRARGDVLGGDVDHLDFAFAGVMGKLGHGSTLRYVFAKKDVDGFACLQFFAVGGDDEEAIGVRERGDVTRALPR